MELGLSEGAAGKGRRRWQQLPLLPPFYLAESKPALLASRRENAWCVPGTALQAVEVREDLNGVGAGCLSRRPAVVSRSSVKEGCKIEKQAEAFHTSKRELSALESCRLLTV